MITSSLKTATHRTASVCAAMLAIAAGTLAAAENDTAVPYDYTKSAALEQNNKATPYDARKEPVIRRSEDTPDTVPGSVWEEHRKQYEERMAWWTQARFGMFVHWGPCVIGDDEISWSREPLGKRYTAAVYDEFYHRFNPTNFNAKELVATAKEAGMKYIVFVTKHHDGFCMWDTQQTDYKITKSPIGRDLLKELADATHEAGLALGFYYSPADLHNPDSQGLPPSPEFKKDERRYSAYMKAQLRELLTNYGKVSILWFDAGYPSAPGWDANEFYQEMQKLQPGIIINNRCNLPADFYTPEQRIGSFDMERHWESCMTIYRNGYWSWRSPKNGQDAVKPSSQCLDFLINAASGDGNMLLNVSPGPDGTLAKSQVQVLKEMGSWLKKYGESIYGTRGGPFMPGNGVSSTRRGSSIYLHVTHWDGTVVNLPPISKRIIASQVLSGGEVTVTQNDDGIKVFVPESQRDAVDTIIRLDLDGNAFDIPAVPIESISLAAGKKVITSSVIGEDDADWGGAKALDDNADTRWATDNGVTNAWLEVDLGKPETFSAVSIQEAFPGRVKEFSIEYRNGANWETIFKAGAMGEAFKRTFSPVNAQQVRLHILDSSGGPTIAEFKILARGN